MGAGYSADILCTVTLEARQERRDQGSLSNFLYSRYIIVFRTSKVVSTKPSPFHLQIFRGDEAAAASCPQNNGELWLAEAGSRDHNAHLWLVRCCCPSCWCWPCRCCSACPPSSTPGSWGELWLVEPQYSPLIGGAAILTSDWWSRNTHLWLVRTPHHRHICYLHWPDGDPRHSVMDQLWVMIHIVNCLMLWHSCAICANQNFWRTLI